MNRRYPRATEGGFFFGGGLTYIQTWHETSTANKKGGPGGGVFTVVRKAANSSVRACCWCVVCACVGPLRWRGGSMASGALRTVACDLS